MTVSDLERIGRERGAYFTASDLLAMEFPEPRWAVPGLVAEGLNLLVGSPKLGKSWFCIGLAVAIASGGRALGSISVVPGPVLYAALEDNPRRLQGRLHMVLGGDAPPSDLHITTALPRLPDLYDVLDGWLGHNPTARLVIVDVLRKIRPIGDGRGNPYNEDYDALGLLKALADKHAVAMLVVHHTRKAADDSDVFNEVSGSTGLTGAADAVLIAKRARNTSEADLHVTGRDVTEQTYRMRWEPGSCTWTLTDEPPALASMGATRRSIATYVAGNEGCSPIQVAQALDIAPNTVRQTMRRMVEDDQLGTDGDGRYFLPALSQPSPLSPLRDTGDSGDTTTTEDNS